MKRLILLTGTIATVLVATGISGYGENNVIFGCYQKERGQVRIVSDPGECLESEVAISWNQACPQGVNLAELLPGTSWEIVNKTPTPESDAVVPIDYETTGRVTFNEDGTFSLEGRFEAISIGSPPESCAGTYDYEQKSYEVYANKVILFRWFTDKPEYAVVHVYEEGENRLVVVGRGEGCGRVKYDLSILTKIEIE